MHAFKQRPAHLLKSNNASIFAHHARSPSLTGIKSRSGSITMDNAAEDLTSFRGHISGDLPILEGVSAGMANESYSLLLKRQQEVQSPTSSGGQLSPHSEHQHRQTSLGKDVWARSKSTEHEPKIIITPVVTDRFDPTELNSFSARQSLIRTSPFSPKKPSVGKKLSVFLKRKFTGDMSETSSIDSSKHQVEDPLTRKHTATFNRQSRSESGRLLSIIAKQAVIGRNHEVSKVFHVALEKSNTEALRKAKKHLHADRRKRIIRFCKNVKNRVMHVVDPWKPDSLFVILWKVWILAMILMHCFCSTYIVSFVPEGEQNMRNWIFLLDFIGDIFFLLEILFLFQVGYYYHGELRCERSDIVYHYLTTKFPLDMLTLVSLIGRVLSNTGWQYLILFTLVRTYKIKPLFAAIEDYLQLSREATSVVRVAKLSGLMIVLAHFCACGLYVLTDVEADEDNWIQASGLAGKSQREIYVTSLYWSVTTMTTVGFGDIAPRTMVERLFVVAVMIVSSIIFGYILSTIGTLLLEVGARSAEAKEKIRILTKYMNDKGLHKDIQSKIRKYLEFYLDRENTAKIEGDFIMKMLSPNLQEELVREVNAKTIYDCYIFSSNFRRRFLYMVSKDLIERSYGPDESIYLRKDFTDCSAYFITSGRVDICYERCGISLQKMKKGACFGYMSFFSGKPRDSSAKSLEFTTVFQLMRERFIDKLEGFTTEKETYFMIRDSVVLYNTNQYINLKCYSCGSLEHTVAHCPSLHFTLDPQEVIKEYLVEEQKFRSDFLRRPRKKFHVLSNLEIVQECASQIQMGHQTEVENEVPEDEEFAVGGGSYSSIDEIFDRKVYDPKPLDYVADTTHMKFLDFPEGFKYTSVQTLNQIPGSKRMRQKVGEIETFMKSNYDMYHHNLNIDRVKNFEVYYPMNNITKLMVEFEKVRLEKIVQMRLGFKAKHLGPLLVKSFKMYEKRQSSNLPSSTPLTKLPSLKPKVNKRHSVNITVRRESLAANPSDITLYNSSETQSSFSRFRHKSILGTSSQLTPAYLLGTTEVKKKFDPVEFSQKVGRYRDKDLSTIREDYTDKNEKGSQSNLSIGTPKATPSGFKHFDFRFQGDSLISKIEFKAVDTSTELKTPGKDILKMETKSFLFSPARTDTNNITKQYMVGSDLSDISLEAEPSAGTSEIVDYSKLMQRFPNKTGKSEHRGRPDFIKHKSAQPEQSVAIAGINANMSIPDLMKTETETKKMFKALLQDRLFETDGNHRRSASEEKGKEILKVIDKYKLPRVFNKMTSNNDEEEDQTSGLSLKMYNM